MKTNAIDLRLRRWDVLGGAQAEELVLEKGDALYDDDGGTGKGEEDDHSS